MGLDMYLSKCKTHGYSLKTVALCESYFDWEERGKDKYSFEEWCDGNEKDIPEGALELFRKDRHMGFPYWDDEKRYGSMRLFDSVGYWRKANAIHNWFVQNVQNGEDNCAEYPVSKEQLQELLQTCVKVVSGVKLADGVITNGYSFSNGQMIPNYEPGQVVLNTQLCKTLLPSVSGCFFGSTQYDEYYVADLQDTIRILTNVLENTDFDTEVISYQSSW